MQLVGKQEGTSAAAEGKHSALHVPKRRQKRRGAEAVFHPDQHRHQPALLMHLPFQTRLPCRPYFVALGALLTRHVRTLYAGAPSFLKV